MIVFVHLLNDFSGSPKVLKETVRAVVMHRHRAKLYLGSSGDGALSSCSIPITHYCYHRSKYRFLTLFTYFFSQIVLFIKLLFDKSISRNAVVYVNTLLPFGAALYGWITRRKVIYHIHETSIRPEPLRRWLVGVARMTSCFNIYVSDAHRAALAITGVPSRRIYNALDRDFVIKAQDFQYVSRRDGFFNILMISSLRDYKGIPELLLLCKRLLVRKDIRFQLVVNEVSFTIERYLQGKQVPANLVVHSRVADTVPFYTNASLLLNLSRVDTCVETFGLTILEAMTFGVPVIVPPIGGPAELVSDGIQGFYVDSRDDLTLEKRVLRLADNIKLCEEMSSACRLRALDFSADSYAKDINELVAEVLS